MRYRQVFVLVGLISSSVFATACGGGSSNNNTTTSELATSSGGDHTQTASSSPSPAPATGGTLVIAPMRIRPVQGDPSQHVIELRADGALAADDHVLARIDGNRVLDAQGTVVLEVTADGHLSAPGHGEGAELTADGQLVAPDGRLVVNADGTIEERRNDGTVNRAPFRFENVPANARRTAIVVVAILSMAVASAEQAQAEMSASAAPDASAAPAATAAPAASAAPAGRRRRGH